MFTSSILVTGVSLWDCVVTNVISRQEPGQVNLLQHYYPFPVALQSVYTLLVIIILVTLLDRYTGVYTIASHPCICGTSINLTDIFDIEYIATSYMYTNLTIKFMAFPIRYVISTSI